MKTTVFNLIILDESGSMSGMTQQTLSGCNETLNIIRANAKKNADVMNNFVSIYAFQDGGPVRSRYLIKNARPEDVKDLTTDDYEPYGNTPLLDAVGSTLSELKSIAETHDDATGIVTIMTDGYENSSTRYDWQKVASLISQLRELGWTINLVGANVDVNAMAAQMNIASANALAYQQSEEGTRSMWSKFRQGLQGRYNAEANACMSAPCASVEDRRNRRKTTSEDFFRE